MKPFFRQAALFVLVGLALYALLYYGAERLNDRHAGKNAFYAAARASPDGYDYAILGASHAQALGYEDGNDLLQRRTGMRIINLSTPGGGLVPNRLLIEYLLARSSAASVVYVLDSFVFYSREWNEDRLKDVRLFRRAPLDPVLARLLIAYGARGEVSLGVALDYVSGFSKLNNPERFKPDLSEDEKRFGRVHRPSSRDAKRVQYLYPERIDEQTFARYLSMFRDLVRELKSRGIGLVVVRPPIPKRFRDMVPGEAQFDRRIEALLAGQGIPLYDFSGVDNDPRYFFDSDHLNRAGVLNFFERHLVQTLIRHRRPGGTAAAG